MKRFMPVDDRPLVSIVVPIFNTSKYLDKCLKSIIGQTYNNIEVILVNDGSTDQSLEIAKKYRGQDSRIIIINQKNSGGIIARKNGITRAKGEYIIIEDSDDWLEKNLVEDCVNAVRGEKSVDIVKFGFILEPSGKKYNLLNDGLVSRAVLEKNDIDQIFERLLYNSDCNQIWNEMVRKDLFDFEDEVFEHIVHKGEDLQINLQIFQKAKKVVLLKDDLYHYTKNPNGITNSISVEKVISNVKDNIYLNKIRKEIALKRYSYVDDNILINKTLSLLSSKVIRILATSENPKEELLLIQDGLEEDLESFLEGFSKDDLNQNWLQKMIIMNIMDRRYDKNMIFKPLCKIIARIK